VVSQSKLPIARKRKEKKKKEKTNFGGPYN
jgi:hypothetical protein